MENSKLQEFISNDEFVRLAIQDAIHRFYYDKVISKNPIDSEILTNENVSAIHSTLWHQHPDWRYKLVKHTKRHALGNHVEITSMPIFLKPNNYLYDLNISISIDITKENDSL